MFLLTCLKKNFLLDVKKNKKFLGELRFSLVCYIFVGSLREKVERFHEQSCLSKPPFEIKLERNFLFRKNEMFSLLYVVTALRVNQREDLSII